MCVLLTVEASSLYTSYWWRLFVKWQKIWCTDRLLTNHFQITVIIIHDLYLPTLNVCMLEHFFVTSCKPNISNGVKIVPLAVVWLCLLCVEQFNAYLVPVQRRLVCESVQTNLSCSNRHPLLTVHWDPYAVLSLEVIALSLYCNTLEWFCACYCWLSHLTCKSCPRNDL